MTAHADRTPVFAANWKMNLGPSAAREFMTAFAAGYTTRDDREVLFFPSALAFQATYDVAKNIPTLACGVQNVYTAEKGAFTGENSAMMANDAGATYALVGHSERRHVFGETDAQCADKCVIVEQAGLRPLLCVGETLEQRERGETEAVVVQQLTQGIAKLADRENSLSVIAYEPVWAIGTGRNATPDDAGQIHTVLRNALISLVGEPLAQRIRILYGGSVSPDNVGSLLAAPHVDGVLVGGASLKVESWLSICES